MALIDYVLGIIHQDEEGQGLAEYALILALIAIVAIVALIFLGTPGLDDPVEGRLVRLASALSAVTSKPGHAARLRDSMAARGARTHHQRSAAGLDTRRRRA